jgi:hypothetical protein
MWQQRTETHVNEITNLHHLVEPSSEWQDGLEGNEFSKVQRARAREREKEREASSKAQRSATVGGGTHLLAS